MALLTAGIVISESVTFDRSGTSPNTCMLEIVTFKGAGTCDRTGITESGTTEDRKNTHLLEISADKKAEHENYEFEGNDENVQHEEVLPVRRLGRIQQKPGS